MGFILTQAISSTYTTHPYCYMYYGFSLKIRFNLGKFFSLPQISKNKCQITTLTTIHLDAQKSNLAAIFGDLNQREKLSEI